MAENRRFVRGKDSGHCGECPAKCCRYFALQIDTPRTKEDFEKIRWYLAHKGVTVFVEKRKWFLDVANECLFLKKGHKCGIYENRPLVCREHSPYDCERDSTDFEHQHVFKSLSDLDGYLSLRFKARPGKRELRRPRP